MNNSGKIKEISSKFHSFVPYAPFLYPLKTENLTVFWCFQGDGGGGEGEGGGSEAALGTNEWETVHR